MKNRRRAPENAPVNLKRIWYQLHPERPAQDVWIGLCAKGDGRYRCVLPKNHTQERCVGGSAARYQFLRAGGDIPPGWVLAPKNGDWDDLTFENWEPITHAEHWQQRFRRPSVRAEKGWVKKGDVWHKQCTECEEWKPVNDFPIKRGQCNDCWADIRRDRNNASYARHRDEGCVIVKSRHLPKGLHFHIGKFGAPKTDEQRDALRLLGVARYLTDPVPRKRRRATEGVAALGEAIAE